MLNYVWKLLLNGILMDIFGQNEWVSSRLQFSEKELQGTHHCSLAKSHHAVLSSTSCHGHGAPIWIGSGCLRSCCCTTLAILSACEFPSIRECKIVFVDERVFVLGCHQRLDHGFGKEEQLWGPSPSWCGLSGPGVGGSGKGCLPERILLEGPKQSDACSWLSLWFHLLRCPRILVGLYKLLDMFFEKVSKSPQLSICYILGFPPWSINPDWKHALAAGQTMIQGWNNLPFSFWKPTRFPQGTGC